MKEGEDLKTGKTVIVFLVIAYSGTLHWLAHPKRYSFSLTLSALLSFFISVYIIMINTSVYRLSNDAKNYMSSLYTIVYLLFPQIHRSFGT